MKKIIFLGISLFFVSLVTTSSALAADADCTAAGGACKATCGPVISGVACSTSGYSCCGTASVAPASGANIDISVPNPLGFSSVEGFLTGGILRWLQGVIVTLSLVFFVIGALLYITGGVDKGNIDKGKAAMTAALIGLALGIGAPTFLKEIYTIFGVSGAPAGPTLVQIALNVLKFLLSIVGILTIIMLVVSGLAHMTSAGDSGRADTAKKMATSAAIGLALALASLILVRQISRFFM